MTVAPKSTDPADRIGVYKTLDDVPDRHRLYHHAAAYEGRDVWAEYESERFGEDYSEQSRAKFRRAGRRWKEHMADRGRHHALARPEDVETYLAGFIDDLKMGTVYRPYYVHVRQFYDWLLWHRDHPHVYHPVLMAAAAGGAAREVFDYQTRRTNQDND